MKIEFRNAIEFGAAEIFEQEYPEELRMSPQEKEEQYHTPGAVFIWMYVDGILVGECYGIPLDALDEPIEGLPAQEEKAMYCYSNTILASHKGQGFGTILKANWLGAVKACGFDKVYGHARAGGSQALALKFGGQFLGEFPNWYETGETYKLYKQELG